MPPLIIKQKKKKKKLKYKLFSCINDELQT